MTFENRIVDLHTYTKDTSVLVKVILQAAMLFTRGLGGLGRTPRMARAHMLRIVGVSRR